MLKSLEMFGFKSFADRTRFDFSTGITCVVGPNGSGKSNVVDAIKWILGDQSPKSLRGKDMTDVIFNGAAGRKPSAFAEATLTFDNTKNLLPIDCEEVAVGRRIWRNGDSEYLINRGAARLKDIRDLFMGTGAATSAYSIIEQGRVDQILQANASARRMVFEEAAGVSRYKSRKNDALRKLERVGQNLERLTDIVDEVEAQLNSTRNQAAKAAKYRQTSQELRALWIGLAADDYRHQSAELSELQQAVDEYNAELEDLNERQNKLESQLKAFDVEIAEVDERSREVERHSSKNRETMASHQSTVLHQTSRQNELEAELIRLRRQRTLMAARVREVAGEFAQTAEEVEHFESKFDAQQDELAALEQQVRELSSELSLGTQELEQNRQQQLELTRQLSTSDNHVAGLQSQLEATEHSKQEFNEQRAALAARIAECQSECDGTQARVDDSREQLEAIDERIAEIQDRRQTLIGEQDEFQKRLIEQREQRSAWQARQHLLEDMERRQEGLGIGVKEILSRAKSSSYPPWNRIFGSVVDLLEVDLEQAALLEVALGERAQLIVIDDYVPLIDYLNLESSQISGRVGFIALVGPSDAGDEADRSSDSESEDADQAAGPLRFDHFQIPLGELPDLSDQPGVMTRADRLVLSAEKVTDLAEQLLADTWIVNTLQIAISLATGVGRGCRFVTLQGELIDNDGTLTVGTVNGESALVSRKSELRRLKTDLARLIRKITDEEKQLGSLDDSLTNIDDELQAGKHDQQDINDSLAELRSQLAGQRQEAERLGRDQSSLDEQISRCDHREQKLRDEIDVAQSQLTETENDLQQLQREIGESETALADIDQRRQALVQQHTSEQLKMAKQEERRAGLQEAFERLKNETRQRSEQHNEAERRFVAADEKRRQIILHVLNASAVLAELYLAEEVVSQQVATLLAEKSELRKQRSVFGEDEARIRKQRRQLSERQHTEEMKVRDLRHQLQSAEQRIEEEYQLKLADVVESGASAFRDYLLQQQDGKHKSKKSRSESADESGQMETAESNPSDTTIDSELAPNAEPEVESEDDTQSDTATEPSTEEDTDSEASRPEDLEDAAEAAANVAIDPELTTDIKFEDVREELETRVNRLRRKMKLMGSVNTDSLNDLDELEQRFGHLNEQLQDLVEAKSTLEEIVRKINSESQRLFTESFNTIRGHFQELYRRLFGGGEGDVILEDPDDVLECNIDIVARPPGKELRSISLLSGGEKTLTAVALLMSIFRSRPSPFCILDEVDAALDEANVERYTSVVKLFQETTQFIMITHSKRSMTVADIMYGVTMEQSGVSKRMSVRFEDVSEDGAIKSNAVESPSPNQADEAA